MTTGPIRFEERTWLAYGEDYTVSDLESQDTGGTLTLMAAIPPEAEQLVIRRITPRTQEIDLHNGARLPAELIEGMSDKATMQIQEISEQTITRDNTNEILQMMNDAIVEARDAVWEALDKELQEAIEEEAQARIQRDAELTETDECLQRQIDSLRAKQDEHQEVIEYLILLYESRFGPISGRFPLITEGGFYLKTEESDFLVVA